MVLLEYLFWVLTFLTPFIIIPLAWKHMEEPKWARLLAGVLLSLILSSIFYMICIAIIFRDGMGPG